MAQPPAALPLPQACPRQCRLYALIAARRSNGQSALGPVNDVVEQIGSAAGTRAADLPLAADSFSPGA